MAEPLLTAVEDQLAQWASSNRGSFVVLAFVEGEKSPKNAAKVVKKALKPAMGDLKKLVDTQKGTKLLLEKLQ
jgi:hypothetical protein